MRAGEAQRRQEQQQGNDRLAVGLDIAKQKVDVCLRLGNGKYRNKVVTNNASGFEELVQTRFKCQHALDFDIVQITIIGRE